MVVPGSSDLSPGYRQFSSVIGWIYFFAWTTSFYPQVRNYLCSHMSTQYYINFIKVFLNYSRKTTVGMVSDKLVYDFIGFSCLSVYCIAFYYIDSIRDDYEDKNNGNSPKVAINDVFFAVHALLMTFVQMGQMTIYNGLVQLPSRKCLMGSAIVILLIIIYLTLCVCINKDVFILLYWLYFLSYIKIGVTLIKYVPQMLLNAARKSTIGWSITACTLDLIGSSLSLLQLILDCNDTSDWSGILGDLVKFALGIVSIVFDFIFFTQHYILYPSHSDQLYSPLFIKDTDSSDIICGQYDSEAYADKSGTLGGPKGGQGGPEDRPVYYTDERLWQQQQAVVSAQLSPSAPPMPPDV